MIVDVQVTLELTVSAWQTGEIAEIIVNNTKIQVQEDETVKRFLQRLLSEDEGTREVFQETLAEAMKV